MIVDLKYAKEIEWSDGIINKDVILIAIIPETKKETKECHLLRWQIKNNFLSLLEWMGRTWSSKPESEIKYISPEDYKKLIRGN